MGNLTGYGYHSILARASARNIGGWVNSSMTNTMTQALTATVNKPLPKYANAIAATRAIAAAMGDCVAWMMAGKVITARVT